MFRRIHFTILMLLVASTGFAQLDLEHFIAPMFASNHAWTIPGEQVVYLSTPSQDPVNYTIKDGAGNLLKAGTVSNAAPVSYQMNGYGTDFIVDKNDLNKILTGRGIHVEADSPVYCNLRAKSHGGGSQATSLTAKGKIAKGTIFRIGHYPSPQKVSNFSNSLANKSSTVGIYATEDNTTFTIDLSHKSLKMHGPSGPNGNNIITVSLNKGETYVVAIKNEDAPNRNPGKGMVGGLITSNKPIVVNCGSWGGNLIKGDLVDVGIDQIVPYEKVGTEYAIVKGESNNQWHEQVMVVAHTNGTKVYVNGSTTPIKTLNAGEHFLINGSYYKNGAMYVTTNVPAYAYQFLMGSGAGQGKQQGMNFLPPISCKTSNYVDNIPWIQKIAGKTYGGSVSIVTTKGANITVNGASPTVAPKPVPGSIYEMYKIRNLKGHVNVHSNTIALVSFNGQNNDAGYGGFYSGWEEAEIKESVTCLPGYLFETTGRYQSYQWYKDGVKLIGETNDSLFATETGYYTYEYTLAGCRDTSDSILAVGLTEFQLQGDTFFCPRDEVQWEIIGQGFDSISWNNGAIIEQQTINIDSSGTTPVRIYSDIARECFVDTFVFTLELPKPEIELKDTAICVGQFITLDAQNPDAASWVWSTGETTQTIEVDTAGEYSVEITSVGGCEVHDTILIETNDIDVVLPNDTAFCLGETYKVVAQSDSAVVWNWNNGETGQSITVDATGDYKITVENSFGCADSDSISITVHDLPIVTVRDTAICPGGTGTFEAVSATATDYLWQKEGKGTAQTTIGTEVGFYEVIVTDANGCKDTTEAELTLHTPPIVSVNNDTICIGDPAATFTATSATAINYTWSDNGTGTAQTTTGTTAGDYTVIVEDVNTCKDTATGVLKVDTLPIVTLQGAAICDDVPNVGLTAQCATAVEYTWSGLGTGNTQTIPASTEGNYIVTVTDENGCESQDNADLQRYDLPTVTVDDEMVCAGDTAIFTAVSATATQYQWLQNGSGNISTTLGSMVGTYEVIVTDGNGCKDTAQAELTYHISPIVSVNNDTICIGDSPGTFTADCSTAIRYTWSENGTGSQATTNGSVAGNYTVVVSDVNSCMDTATGVLRVDTLPHVFVDDTVICSNITGIQMRAHSKTAVQYDWSGMGTGNSESIEASNAGNYVVTVTDENGCQQQDNAVLNIVQKPEQFEILGDSLACEGDQIDLHADVTAQSYSWTSTETDQGITVKLTGISSVTASNSGFGITCSTTASKEVEFLPYPVQPDVQDFMYCFDFREELMIDIPSTANFEWEDQPGRSDSTLIVTQEGIYNATLYHYEMCPIEVPVLVEEFCPFTFFVPNAFTPNGDGLNETFQPKMNNIESYKLMIFNRWGEHLFTSTDQNIQWDGRVNGHLVQEDVYVYKIIVSGYAAPENLEERRLVGTVTVIR